MIFKVWTLIINNLRNYYKNITYQAYGDSDGEYDCAEQRLSSWKSQRPRPSLVAVVDASPPQAGVVVEHQFPCHPWTILQLSWFALKCWTTRSQSCLQLHLVLERVVMFCSFSWWSGKEGCCVPFIRKREKYYPVL